MFYDLLKLLTDTLTALFGVTLLARVFVNWVGLPARNPVAQFVLALTDWLVKPLRRVVPDVGRLESAALLCAYLVAVLSLLVPLMLAAAEIEWFRILIAGFIRLLQWALDGLFWLTVLYALLSWINPHAPIAPAIGLLMRPFIAPFRRIVPLVGGVDLSPMALVLVIVVLREIMSRLSF